MKLQPKNTAVPVNWTRSLFMTGAFGMLTLIAYIAAPPDEAGGLFLSIGFFILWSAVIGISVKHGQWLPLLVGSIYLLGASAIRLYADNALQSERGIPTLLRTVLDFSDRPLNGFSYLGEGLQVMVTALLALLTLVGLVIVMDRNKPRILEDSDPIDW